MDADAWTFDTLREYLLSLMQAHHDVDAAVHSGLIERIESADDVTRQRFAGMDEATKVLHETVTRIPTDVQQAVGHLKELMEERFSSVGTQFKERDTRSEREARDNKLAVDAAFAAQEKQAVAQNESNALAISKSEAATTETINKLAELVKSTTDALSDKIDDLKSRVSSQDLQIIGLISQRQGAREQVVEHRAAGVSLNALVGSVVAVILVAIAVVTLVLNSAGK